MKSVLNREPTASTDKCMITLDIIHGIATQDFLLVTLLSAMCMNIVPQASIRRPNKSSEEALSNLQYTHSLH